LDAERYKRVEHGVCTTDYATVIKFVINYAAIARLHFPNGRIQDFVKGCPK